MKLVHQMFVISWIHFITESFTGAVVYITHGFKNRTGHRTVFLKISGSTPVFDRFLAGFSVVDRLLTGFEAFNRTGLAPGSRLNRSDRPVRSGF